MVAPRVTSSVPWRPRLLLSGLIGLAAGWKTYQPTLVNHAPRDFAQVWYAARALLAGKDPYQLIGPGRAFEWGFPFFYPLPAAVGVVPLAPLSMHVAEAVFMGLGIGCFTWALMRNGYTPLLCLLSAAMVGVVESVQWSPLLAASLALPALGVFAVAKPTIGFAMFVARPTWWAVVGGAVLLVASFAVQPHWLSEWRAGLSQAHHFAAPIAQPGGWVAALALLRWRLPEARLVFALACVPQSTMIYETIPLLLVPQSVVEVAILVVLGYATQIVAVVTAGPGVDPLYHLQPWLWMLYLPCVLMVLRRPNEGHVPAWLERRIALRRGVRA
jgi:hypothetical protein